MRLRTARLVTQAQALETFGPEATSYDVRRRLRCTVCGRRNAISIWI
jgi:ribosomal protein S14